MALWAGSLCLATCHMNGAGPIGVIKNVQGKFADDIKIVVM